MLQKSKKDDIGFIGYTLVNDGKYNEAFKLANEYLYFDRKWNKSGRDTKAYCLFKMKKYNESLAILDKRLLFDPNDDFVLGLKTYRLSLIGRHAEAMKSANKLVRVTKKDSRLWKLYESYGIKAYVLYNAGKYDLAIKYYKESLKSKPLRRYIKDNAKEGIERCKEKIKST